MATEPARPDPRTLPVFVWATELGKECLIDRHPWIDEHLVSGTEAFIWLYGEEDEPVYRYGHPNEPVAHSWAEFAAKENLPPDEPQHVMNLIERIKPPL